MLRFTAPIGDLRSGCSLGLLVVLLEGLFIAFPTAAAFFWRFAKGRLTILILRGQVHDWPPYPPFVLLCLKEVHDDGPVLTSVLRLCLLARHALMPVQLQVLDLRVGVRVRRRVLLRGALRRFGHFEFELFKLSIGLVSLEYAAAVELLATGDAMAIKVE